MTTNGITLAPEAIAKLNAIGEHVAEIGHAYGTSSADYRAACESWVRVQTSVWGLLASGGTLHYGGAPLEMSLTTSGGLYVAVVFSPDRDERFKPDEQGDQRFASLCVLKPELCGNHGAIAGAATPCIRHRVRQPGTWSMHS